jgi:hypothetical protein
VLAFFNHINLLSGAVASQFCTVENCPTMSGPGTLQYQWTDERGKKIKCGAPQYIDLVMSFVEKTIRSEDAFPTKCHNAFPVDFLTTVRKLMRLLWHVLSHQQCRHREHFDALGLGAQLSGVIVHFGIFVAEFDLLKPDFPKDAALLADVSVQVSTSRQTATAAATSSSTATGMSDAVLAKQSGADVADCKTADDPRSDATDSSDTNCCRSLAGSSLDNSNFLIPFKDEMHERSVRQGPSDGPLCRLPDLSWSSVDACKSSLPSIPFTATGDGTSENYGGKYYRYRSEPPRREPDFRNCIVGGDHLHVQGRRNALKTRSDKPEDSLDLIDIRNTNTCSVLTTGADPQGSSLGPILPGDWSIDPFVDSMRVVISAEMPVVVSPIFHIGSLSVNFPALTWQDSETSHRSCFYTSPVLHSQTLSCRSDVVSAICRRDEVLDLPSYRRRGFFIDFPMIVPSGACGSKTTRFAALYTSRYQNNPVRTCESRYGQKWTGCLTSLRYMKDEDISYEANDCSCDIFVGLDGLSGCDEPATNETW